MQYFVNPLAKGALKARQVARRALVTVTRPKWPTEPRVDLLRDVNRDFYTFHGLAKAKGFQRVGSGSYRTTYAIDKNWVLKLPNSASGERDNIFEALVYAHDPDRRAKCELIDFEGVWALKMERLRMPDDDEYWKVPGWVSQLTRDGRQCGYRANKELVVYDFAYPIQVVPNAQKAFRWLLDHYGTY